VVKSWRDAAAIYWTAFIAFGYGGARDKPSETQWGCRALTGRIDLRILRPRVDDRSTADSRAHLEITLTGVAQSNGIALRSQKLHENFAFAVRWVACRGATAKRGAHVDNAAKGSFEMRLASESTCQRNLSQRLPRGCHHEFGGLDASRCLLQPKKQTSRLDNIAFILDGEPSRISPCAACTLSGVNGPQPAIKKGRRWWRWEKSS
jgi:hypothetical protein